MGINSWSNCDPLNVKASPLFRDYSEAFNSIYSSIKKTGDDSFSAWFERAKLCREVILKKKEEHAKELAGMEKVWAKEVIAEKAKEFSEQETYYKSTAKKMIVEDLEKILAQKTALYDKAMSAPTDEMLRLLAVLQMRQDSGEQLTSKDFANVTGKLANNFHALKQLENLAHKAEVPFPCISDDFREYIDTVREAPNSLLASIDIPTDDLGYLGRLFWTAGNAGRYQNAFDKLESLSYLNITPESIEQASLQKALKEEAVKEQTAGDKSSRFCSKVVLEGNESIFAICNQFRVSRSDIQELNPDINLNELHKGGTLYIPSTKFSFMPNATACVQEHQVQLAEKPKFTHITGSHGELPGDDVDLLLRDSAFD